MSDTDDVFLTISRNVTGRDSDILEQALYIAAMALMAKPIPESNEAEDMIALLKAVWSPDSFERMKTIDLIHDGRAMGFDYPGMDVTTIESARAWIDKELSDQDEQFLLEAAVEKLSVLNAHLLKCSKLKISDMDARMELEKANATIRILSGRLSATDRASSL